MFGSMHWIDWSILGFVILSIVIVTTYAKSYSHTVADFLAANRLAGRYLLTVSSGFFGVISLVGVWEITFSTGLTPQWWANLQTPVGLFLALTGFIIYRFRQTRALTMAQFFEERYSRNFRYFAGFLCWLSGVLNYGIFPAVTANVMIYFLDLPLKFMIYGYEISTFPLIMGAYLLLAVYVACSGGQITIMITDFIQGALLMLIFVAILLYLLGQYPWNDIMAGLDIGGAKGTSKINPFSGSSTDEFSVWFYLIAMVSSIYNARSWQGNSGYNASAKTPHEAVVAGVVANWRGLVSTMCVLVIPLIAYAVLHLPEYSAVAQPIQEQINAIPGEQMQMQMTVPIFLREILPVGLAGLFAAVIFGCAISCDDTYLHAWGTILIQDVIGPIRNKPFSPKNHLLYLRISIVGVALFGFLFSMYFPLKGYIFMFFALSGAIYMGGAGAVIIGGLYWKRGTTAAAWTALTLGTVLGFGGIVIEQLWPTYMLCFNINDPELDLSLITYTCAFFALIGIVLLIAGVIMKNRRLSSRIICLAVGVAVTVLAGVIGYKWVAIATLVGSNEIFSAFLSKYATKFPINGQWIYFWAMVSATAAYILVSLLGPKKVFNMDKLLHQGEYAVKSDEVIGDAESVVEAQSNKLTLAKIIGISKEFSRFERILFYATFIWTMGWWAIFIIGTVINLIWKQSDEVWSWYWWFYIWISAVLGIGCTCWIFCGGLRDAVRLLRDLKSSHESNDDDGFVYKK